MSDIEKHWDQIYATKSDHEVSWFQTTPTTSINLIQKYSLTKNDAIIDIGGGNSNLLKELCELGHKNCSVLDISVEALNISKTKLKLCKNNYKYIHSNILEFNPDFQINIWHDRAVFHFLTKQNDIEKYVETASNSIIQNGYLILATFSKTGPLKCSGLPISQYNKAEIDLLFSETFIPIDAFEQTHETPFKTQQNFIWNVLKRK